MATVDRQVVNGTTYMIKDSQARADVSDLRSAISDGQGNVIPSAELKSATENIRERIGYEMNLASFENVHTWLTYSTSDYKEVSQYSSGRSVVVQVTENKKYYVKNYPNANLTLVTFYQNEPEIDNRATDWFNLSSTQGGEFYVPSGYNYALVEFWDHRNGYDDGVTPEEAFEKLIVSEYTDDIRAVRFENVVKDSIPHDGVKGLSQIFRDEQFGYTDYYANVINPSGVSYTNKPVQIKVAFDIGECPNESRIKVFKNGTEMPCQFEGCKQNNYTLDHDATYWPNGNVKCGTVWVYDSINASANSEYIIRVYKGETETDYQKSITVDGSEIWNNFSVSDGVGNIYHFRGKLNSASKRLYQKNNDDDFYDNSNYNTSNGRVYVRDIPLKSVKIEGDGTIFIDVIYEYENDSLNWKQVCRIVKGSIIERAYIIMLETVTDWGIRDMRSEFALGNDVTFGNSISENFYAYRFGSNTVSVIYANGNIPRSDAGNTIPNFIPFVTTDGNRIRAGWNSSSAMWDVPAGFVFTFDIFVSINCDSDEHLRQFNPLCSFATKKTKSAIMDDIKRKLVPHMKDVSDYIQNNGVSAGGMNQWSKYYRYKYQKLLPLSSAIALFNDAIVDNYNLSDKQSFLDAYETWGLPYMGRAMPLAYEYYKECKKAGDIENQESLKSLSIECGEAMVDILNEYDDIPLTAGEPESVRNNARTMALHLLAIACVLDPDNTRLSEGYQRLGQIIIQNSDLNTMLKEGNLSTSRYTHYMSMALIDWILSNLLIPVQDNSGFKNYNNFVMDTTEPSGEIKDQEYCPSTARRGLEHTYSYYSGSLILLQEYSGLAFAEKMIDHLIKNSLPDGNFIFPMDHFTDAYLGTQTINGAIPFELAAFIEVLNVVYGDVNISSKDQLATKYLSSGVVSNGTNTTINNQNIVRSGNVITFKCEINKPSGNYTEDEIIGNIAYGFRPRSDVLMNIVKYGSNSSVEYAIAKANGQILVWSKNTAGFNGSVQVFGTYIAY